jgi:hypothetical protein
MVGRPDQGWCSLQSQRNLTASLADRIGMRRLAGWVRRSCRAMLADLELTDCGSLEVLLYCTDDVAVGDASRSSEHVFERVHHARVELRSR